MAPPFRIEPSTPKNEPCSDCYNEDNEFILAAWLVGDHRSDGVWVCLGHLMARLGFYLQTRGEFR